MGNPMLLLQTTSLSLVSVLYIDFAGMNRLSYAMHVASLCSPQKTTTCHPSSSAFSFPFLESRQSRAR